MATSGTAVFNLDLSEVVEEAFERCGSELRTGYDLRTARRSLNLLFADWANRGINMWTMEQGTITLTYNQMTYALPNDTVDLLTGAVRTGAYVVEVIDVVTGADSTGTLRLVTSQIYDGVDEFLLLESGDKIIDGQDIYTVREIQPDGTGVTVLVLEATTDLSAPA